MMSSLLCSLKCLKRNNEGNSELSPEVLCVIQALEEYRFRIHACIYRSYFYDREIKFADFNRNPEMVGDSSPSFRTSESSQVEAIIEQRLQLLKKMRRLEELALSIFEMETPDLRSYIDSNKRAAELQFMILQLLNYSVIELLSDRWDIAFINIVEALRMKIEQDKIFPLWYMLSNKDKTVPSNDGFPYAFNETNDRRACLMMATNLGDIEKEFSGKHISYVCNHYDFHCRYLDDEIANMFNLMRNGSKSHAEVGIIDLWSTDEGKLDITEILLEKGDGKIDKSSLLHHLHFYRACVEHQKNGFADDWMKLRFGDNFDSKKRRFLIQNTKRFLRKQKTRRRGERIPLNGNSVGVSSDYRLPVLKTEPVGPSEKPWWVRQLRTSPEATNQVKAKDCVEKNSCDSQATTVMPTESSTTACTTEVSRDRLRRAASETNRAAANYYRDSNRLSDHDMCKIPMCPVSLNLTGCLKIRWTYHGDERERCTNFVEGGKYHCRSFSYDAFNNEWFGKDDYCHILRQLDVKHDGAFRVPIIGDSGHFLGRSIFKVHKDAGDHTIDSYLADVRAQSIAAHYANRFRELTENNFGCLQMLSTEILMVFDSPERQKIIEMMTCESYLGNQDPNTTATYVKFTNNWSFKHANSRIDLLEAFSHFSYVESDGVLMVTDLQGFYERDYVAKITYLLTDPAIHCQSRSPLLFGRGNLGEEGMEAFFSDIHTECNEVCHYLNLKRPYWE